MFSLNQIVRGAVCGTFKIIGFKAIGGVDYAILKSFDVASGRVARGQLGLPLDAIKPY